MNDEVVLKLSSDAALVLLVLVARLNESEAVSFDDQAEQRVLWDLEADPESAVPSIISGDFNARVQQARDRLRDVEQPNLLRSSEERAINYHIFDVGPTAAEASGEQTPTTPDVGIYQVQQDEPPPPQEQPKLATDGAGSRSRSRGGGTPRGTPVRHGPLNPGPLADDVANTFRSGTYNVVTTSNPTTLYRVYSDPARQLGPYWTRTRPTGPTQSIIDSALDPAWGNRATSWVQIQVPAGTTFYEGAAAAQRGLVGGGNQVFLPWVDDAWVVRSGGF